MGNRPGGALPRRPLHLIWLLDCSGAMAGKKIETLNFALREMTKPLQDVAEENPQVRLLVRAISFANAARWHIAQPVDVHDLQWTDLEADGVRDMGAALALAADALRMERMPERGFPPVLVLIATGPPTDDFADGLKKLMAQPWGRKAVRVAIAVGDDADRDVLQKFIGHPEVKPLRATNAADLVNRIRWASTVAVPACRLTNALPSGGDGPLPTPPTVAAPGRADEVW